MIDFNKNEKQRLESESDYYQFAIYYGLISESDLPKYQASTGSTQFLIDEIDSRLKGIKTLKASGYKGNITHQDLYSRFDLVGEEGKSVSKETPSVLADARYQDVETIYCEVKCRNIPSTLYEEDILSYPKYKELVGYDNAYYICCFSDNVSYIYNIKNCKVREGYTHHNKYTSIASEKINEKMVYFNKKDGSRVEF